MHTITRRSFLRGVGATLGLPTALIACAEDSPERAGIAVVRTPHDGLVPSAQFDAEGALHVAFLQGQDVQYVVSRDGGTTFGAPLRVNDRPGYAAGGLFRGPEMAIGDDGSVHVIWYSRAWELSSDRAEQGAMYTRLVPAAAFEPSRNVGREPSDGLSVAVRAGQVAIAWHNGEILKVIRSDDGGRSFAMPLPFDALPCECCGTSLRITPAGTTLIAYRDRKDDRRDEFIATVDRGAARARTLKLDKDSWIMKACPLSGTGTALVDDGAIVTWEHEGRIMMTRLGLTAWRRSDPVAIGEGKYPIVLANAASLLVAWSAGKKLVWQTYDAASLRLRMQGSVPRNSSHRAAGALSTAGKFVLVV